MRSVIIFCFCSSSESAAFVVGNCSLSLLTCFFHYSGLFPYPAISLTTFCFLSLPDGFPLISRFLPRIIILQALLISSPLPLLPNIIFISFFLLSSASAGSPPNSNSCWIIDTQRKNKESGERNRKKRPISDCHHHRFIDKKNESKAYNNKQQKG